MGRKRASPGLDEAKNPLGEVELSEAHAGTLDNIAEEARHIDISLGTRRHPPERTASYLMPHWISVEFFSQERYSPFLLKRRELLKNIPKFWPVALLNHPTISMYAAHHQDQVALGYLEDVWSVRDPKERRCFTVEFVRRFRIVA